MRVIYHSRRNFYNGRSIYWYEFISNDGSNITLPTIANKFLRVEYTIYYEYGGTHEEAIFELTNYSLTDIVEGKEI